MAQCELIFSPPLVDSKSEIMLSPPPSNVYVIKDEVSFRDLVKSSVAEVFAKRQGASVDVVRIDEANSYSRPASGMLMNRIWNTTKFAVTYVVCDASRGFGISLPFVTFGNQARTVTQPFEKMTLLMPGQDMTREKSFWIYWMGSCDFLQIKDCEGYTLYCPVATNRDVCIDYEFVAGQLMVCNSDLFFSSHACEIDNHFDLIRVEKLANGRRSAHESFISSHVVIEEIIET